MGIKWELEDIENIYPKANEFWIKFARTIFSCLFIKSKELIKRNGIKLKIELSNYSTFNYVEFVQYISYRTISKCVREIMIDSSGYDENFFRK